MPVAASSLRRYLVTTTVAAFLALHAWLAVSATIDLGVTGDETVHLTGGYSYWRFNDFRLQPENGNLPQRWAALPLLAEHPRLEPHDWPEDWKHSDAWMMGQHFFFESGNPIDFLLLSARSLMVLWSVATGLLVFCWARSCWGTAGGLLALALYGLSPTILAHAPLVTSDTCATFWLVAATGAWWRLTERFTLGRFLMSAAAFSVAVVTKFSFVVFLPVAAAIALWQLLQTKPVAATAGDEWPVPLFRRRDRFTPITIVALGHAAAAIAVIWLFYGFRYTAFSPGWPAADFFSSTDGILPPSGALRWLLVNTREFHLLPEAFLHGFAYMLYAARERATFAAGSYGHSGWWWFFPFAFLVKSSLAELSAVLGIAAMLAARFRSRSSQFVHRLHRTIPLLCLAIVYGGIAMASHLNIGQRHILPLYPVLFIVAGGLVRFGGPRTGAVLSILLVGLAAVESFSVRPHYLSFFNPLVGGPAAGWRLLGDSSLDWGQNLPRLHQWLDAHRQPKEPVYLSYFGADDPFYRGINATELSPYFSFGRARQWAPLQAGLYCIGASMLQDASSPYSGPWTQSRESAYQYLRRTIPSEIDHGIRPSSIGVDTKAEREVWNFDRARFARLCLYLRVRPPDAVIGNMIFIFRLSAQDIHAAVDGTMEELAGAMEVAAKRER